MARDGSFVRLREAALYMSSADGVVQTPMLAVSRDFARHTVLLAIEVFDDALVGYSSVIDKLSEETDESGHYSGKPLTFLITPSRLRFFTLKFKTRPRCSPESLKYERICAS